MRLLRRARELHIVGTLAVLLGHREPWRKGSEEMVRIRKAGATRTLTKEKEHTDGRRPRANREKAGYVAYRT